MGGRFKVNLLLFDMLICELCIFLIVLVSLFAGYLSFKLRDNVTYVLVCFVSRG